MELIKKLTDKYNKLAKTGSTFNDWEFKYLDKLGLFGEGDDAERQSIYQAFKKHPEILDNYVYAAEVNTRHSPLADPAGKMHDAIVAADLLEDNEDATLIRNALKNSRYDKDAAIMRDSTRNKDKIIADVNKRAAFDKKVDNVKNAVKSKVLGDPDRTSFEYLNRFGYFGMDGDEEANYKKYQAFKKHPEILDKYVSAVKMDKNGSLKPDWGIMHDTIVDADLLDDDDDVAIIRDTLKNSVFNSEPRYIEGSRGR